MQQVLLFSLTVCARLCGQGFAHGAAYTSDDDSTATFQRLDALEAELNELERRNQEALQGLHSGDDMLKPRAAAGDDMWYSQSLRQPSGFQVPSPILHDTVPSLAPQQQLQQLQRQQLLQQQQQQQQQEQQLQQWQQLHQQPQQQLQQLQQLQQQQQLHQQQQREQQAWQHRDQLLRQRRDVDERLQLLQLRQQQQRSQQEQRKRNLALEEEELSLLQPRLEKRVRDMERVSEQLEASQQRASNWLRAEESAASHDLDLLAPRANLQPTQVHRPQLSMLEMGNDEPRSLRHGSTAGSSTIRVDASFCKPGCQAGRGVCVGSMRGGVLSGPMRCLCEPNFNGESCEMQGDSKQRHTLELALPQTIANVWKQHNPAVAGLLLEAPISMVVNACGVFIVLVASILGCWSLDKARQGPFVWRNNADGLQGQPETERYLHPAAVQRSHVRDQRSSGYVNTSRQQSTFYRYPGANSQISHTAEAAAMCRQNLDGRRVATGQREASMHAPASFSAKTWQQDVPEYLDDDPEDFVGDGFIDDDYEDVRHPRN